MNVIARHDALGAGYTDRELNTGRWQRVRRGYYLDAAGAADLAADRRHLIQVDATVQASSSEAIVSHVSAAVAHGLDLWATPLTQVHLVRDRPTGGRVTPHLVLHSMRIAADEVVTVSGRRLTSVARTVVDIARTLPFEQAVIVGDSALRLGKTSRVELREQLVRYAGPGTPAARRVVDFVDGRAESPGESRSRVHLHAARFPLPELQARIVTPDDRFVARVDFLFPELGVVGEFDGLVKYRSAFRGTQAVEEVVIAEKAREDELRALGWLVVRWTWRELGTPNWLSRLAHAAEIARRGRRIGDWYSETTDRSYGSQGV